MVLCKSIYLINYEANRIEKKDTPDDFNVYIDGLISNMNSNKAIRQYRPRSSTTQVVNLAAGILRDALKEQNPENAIESVEDKFKDIAERLLIKEIETQELIDRLGQKIKKGSLVQALLKGEDASEYFFLVAKVEHSGFIDDLDFKTKTGFPHEQQKIWKYCIFDCLVSGDEILIETAKIYLDGKARYWHDDFLELQEMKDDEANTKEAFKNIESVLTRNIKQKAPSDYTVLRNSVIGYLKTNQHIDYGTMISTIFESYQPTELNSEELSSVFEKLQELPEKKEFDFQFNSVPSAINARIRSVYPVTEGIEIKIKDFLGDIKETIKSIEEPSGGRYLQIKTTDDNTFRAFR